MSSEKIWKIGIKMLHELKTSARRYYITIPKKVVETFELMPGDVLKVAIIEVRRTGEEEEA